ncbi:uncharacterized protein LOC135497238 [Lineus longissimus]|uniref:uncharacterized protein LOC135497238 n=1 Tax=Lineus longissimus TaxID=88925 RepID=UPI00315D7A26
MAADLSLIELAALADDDDLMLYALDENDDTGRESTFDPRWERFDINNYNDEQCKAKFRFSKGEIGQLLDSLAIPRVYKCPHGCIVSGHDGLCMLLRRLVYPNRLVDLEKEFGRPKSVLSEIITTVHEDIYSRFHTKFSQLEQSWMGQTPRDKLQEFANAVHEKGAPLTNCWGFIDGTPRQICRPKYNQKVCFSGHKRYHCIQFQSVVAPNGLIVNLFGPVEGRRHDSAMLRMSNLVRILEILDYRMNDEDRTPICLYGDPAYPLRDILVGPFKGAVLTDEQKEFNKRMSSVRQSVEWQFGEIVGIFAFLDYEKNLKLYLQPVGKLYVVGALLTNCHTCIKGSQTGIYFGVEAPTLEDYLAI